MAFNWPAFWTRAFTALVFAAIMAAGFLYTEWSFFIILVIIHAGCWFEYLKLLEKIHGQPVPFAQKAGFVLLGFHILLWFCGNLSVNHLSIKNSFTLPLLIAGVFMLCYGMFQKHKIHLKQLGGAALGLLYISVSLGLLLQLRLTTHIPVFVNGNFLGGRTSGFYIPIIILVAIWVNDTMAYLVGSAIGKTPFSKISPKKTLEGTIGGMILCILAITLILKPYFYWQVLLGISLLVAFFGTIGDLLESKIKRMAGVKDSGRIMPGHGGFLDRFDSLLLAIPPVSLFLYIWGCYT